MKSLPLTHRIAILALLCVTALNIVSNIFIGPEPIGMRIFHSVLGTAVWGFLTYKIWKRPREWGLGLGIFLFLVLGFQIFLFVSAHTSNQAHTMGAAGHPAAFAAWEVPLLVAAASCLRLRSAYGNTNSSEHRAGDRSL